jgi:hypothetical protein
MGLDVKNRHTFMHLMNQSANKAVKYDWAQTFVKWMCLLSCKSQHVTAQMQEMGKRWCQKLGMCIQI